MSWFHHLWAGVLFVSATTASFAADPLDFSLPDLDGREVSLSEFRGKWVLVNYWATWCPPCLEELPELESFYTNHKEAGAVVLGVNMEDIGTDALRAFVDEQFLSYPILRASPAQPGVLGPVSGLPTSYLVDPKGRVVAQQAGPVTEKAIARFISEYEHRGAVGATR